MDATDTLRGGQRHELGGEPGDDRGIAGEGDAVPDRGTEAIPSGVGMRPRRPGGRGCRLETSPQGGAQR